MSRNTNDSVYVGVAIWYINKVYLVNKKIYTTAWSVEFVASDIDKSSVRFIII